MILSAIQEGIAWGLGAFRTEMIGMQATIASQQAELDRLKLREVEQESSHPVVIIKRAALRPRYRDMGSVNCKNTPIYIRKLKKPIFEVGIF